MVRFYHWAPTNTACNAARRTAVNVGPVWDTRNGLCEISGRLFSTDAHAVDVRLDALAGTVCAEDPRTGKQRRADAMGALAAGADRLACRCGRPDCAAADKPVASPVVINVIAEQATLDGTGSPSGSLIGADALIPPELILDLAGSARLRPLTPPIDAAPEPGYHPWKAPSAIAGIGLRLHTTTY